MSQEITNALNQPIGFSVADWSGAIQPDTTELQGKRCVLKSVQNTEHCTELFNAFSKDTTGGNWTYLPYGPFIQESEFVDWFEKSCVGESPHFYIVFDIDSGLPVGLASYLRINPVAGSIEVGHIHFSPLLQRTVLATEAMYLMMSNVFDKLGYRRYEWKCDALNQPSRSAAQRLGFQYEGIFRQATTYKNRNRDTAWFSIIDSEWPQLKRSFAAWLDESNFDSNGRQRHSLVSLRKQ